ncbi:MAG: hypothetical protein ACHQ5A_13015, partial [Opitutales bacterium]
ASSRAPLREEAYAVLDTSLAVLGSISATDGGLHGPAQGWQDPLAFVTGVPSAGYQASVVVEDESGRLPLPHIDDATLQRYLEGLGCARADAERVIDALSVWTKQDYSATTYEADPHQYEAAALPYAPPQRPLHTWDELRAIRVTRELFFDEHGQWNDLGRRFCADASLHSFAHVNINSARSSVLIALGLDPQQTGNIERLRSDPKATPFFRTVGEASAAWGADLATITVGADALCLRLKITVSQGGRIFHLEAVVANGNTPAPAPPPPATNGGAPGTTGTGAESTPAVRNWTRNRIDYPFRILELHEDTGP